MRRYYYNWLYLDGTAVIIVFRSRFVSFLNSIAVCFNCSAQSGLAFDGSNAISRSNKLERPSRSSTNPRLNAALLMRLSSFRNIILFWVIRPCNVREKSFRSIYLVKVLRFLWQLFCMPEHLLYVRLKTGLFYPNYTVLGIASFLNGFNRKHSIVRLLSIFQVSNIS